MTQTKDLFMDEGSSKPTQETTEKEELIRNAQKKFEQLLPNLIKEHRGKYAAVCEDFVEIDDDKYRLFNKVLKKYGYRTVYIDKIAESKKSIRLRSPRIS